MEPIPIVTDVSLDKKLLERVRKIVRELLEEMDAIRDSWPKRPPVDSRLKLSKIPISLKQTHRYGLLFLGRPIDLWIDTCGLGRVCIPMKIGWNDMSGLSEGTTIALASDSSLSAVYRCIDTLK